MAFQNRTDAGRKLVGNLSNYGAALVLALPRGGVPVAFEVARALDIPLDVLLVRKLSVPGHEELAMGAVASGGSRVLNDELVRALHLPKHGISAVVERETRELRRREALYRGEKPFPYLAGRTVIVVDDGLATGASMRAGVTHGFSARCRFLLPRGQNLGTPLHARLEQSIRHVERVGRTER